jgi:phosphatidylserine/phosphatidylglycerophosphate/cardiolipin synthase-like enzyme
LIGGRAHYETVVHAVLSAKVSVWIATANIKELLVESARAGRKRSWRSVLAAFDELAGRDVDLRILHAGFPSTAFRDAFDRYPRLVRGGLELRQCARIHLKAVIVDGAHLYLGSANWTGAGLGGKGDRNRNFELGLWTEDELLLDHVQELFDHLWRGGECVGCGRREQCDAPIDELPRREK